MSLYIPQWFHEYKFFAIDPGSNITGLSIFTIDGRTHDIKSIEVMSIHLNMHSVLEGTIHDEYKDLELRINRWCRDFINLLYRHSPVAVYYEAPFFNPRFPGAFGPLTKQMTATRYALFDFNPNIPMVVYAPKEIKGELGSASRKGKLVIKQALAQLPEIVNTINRPLDELDDNAIDSIAVGYTAYIRRKRYGDL